jgi:hypothetical protein
LVGVFKEKSTVSVFWLALLSIGLHVHFIADPPQVICQPYHGLVYYLLQYLPGVPTVGLMLLYQIFILLQALRLNYILNEVRLFPKQNLTIAMTYVVVMAVLPDWNNITPALVVNTLLIVLLGWFTKLNQTSNSAAGTVFNIGLLAGFITIFFNNAVGILPWALFSLLILRPFRLNEIGLFIIGAITPFYLLASVLYLTNKWSSLSAFLPYFDIHILSAGQHWIPTSISLVLLVLLFAVGVLYGNNNSHKMLIQARKIWLVLFLGALCLLPGGNLVSPGGLDALQLCLLPASAIMANYFTHAKNLYVRSIVFWLLVAAVLYNNYMWIIVKAY